MNWRSIELNGYSYFSDKGYRILVPLVSGESYDFVAEKNGEFIRVNVKAAGLKSKRDLNSWSISAASGAGNKNLSEVKCDVYLVWLGFKSQFIELPGSFFIGSKSKSKLIPKEIIHN